MAEQRRQSGEIPARIEPGEVALYRFFDRDGALLYVGIAEEPAKRWYAHAHRDWWPTVTRYEVTWYDSRAEADSAERQAVRAERPRHNVVYNRKRRGGSRSCGSPTVTSMVLRRFRGRQFSVLDVAEDTGFSTTSASNTMRALLAAGAAVLVGTPNGSQKRIYQLVDSDPE